MAQNDEGDNGAVPETAKRAKTPMVNPSFWAKRMLMFIEVHGTLSLSSVCVHQSFQKVNH